MKQSLPHPPAWLDRVLEWFVAEELLEEIQGDLHEAYQDRVETKGRQKASWLYARDVLKFFRPYAFEKYSAAKQFLPMVDNYLKVGIRNILYRKGFTTINLVGLTFGISAVMLIGTYLHHELRYDQQGDQHEQVYRLMNHYRDQVYACMPFPDYYQTSEEDQHRLLNQIVGYEEVEKACHFVPSQSAIGGGDRRTKNHRRKSLIHKHSRSILLSVSHELSSGLLLRNRRGSANHSHRILGKKVLGGFMEGTRSVGNHSPDPGGRF